VDFANLMKFLKKTELPEKFELPDRRGFSLTAKRRSPCTLSNPHL